MNCRECQNKILESLAANEGVLPIEVVNHNRTCSGCRRFHETQARFFRAIDAGVQGMVNQATPVSLLPSVRVRLSQDVSARHGWLSGWRLIGFAAALVAVAGISYLTHKPHDPVDSREPAAMTYEKSADSLPLLQTPVKRANNLPSRTKKSVTVRARSEAPIEVIVSAEERRAFAQFLTQLPEEQDVAVALTRPAQDDPEQPVQIALLEIASLEVKPLESESAPAR
jgi:hypothetical protein